MSFVLLPKGFAVALGEPSPLLLKGLGYCFGGILLLGFAHHVVCVASQGLCGRPWGTFAAPFEKFGVLLQRVSVY